MVRMFVFCAAFLVVWVKLIKLNANYKRYRRLRRKPNSKTCSCHQNVRNKYIIFFVISCKFLSISLLVWLFLSVYILLYVNVS